MPVITDPAATLVRPGFWSAYYGSRHPSAVDILARVLGADPDFDHGWLYGPDPYDLVTDDMDEEEEERAMAAAMSAGVTIGVPFPSGHTWSIRFSSSPGIFHSLTVPGGGRRISLGYDDPHFHLPILRWDEARLIAAHLREHPPTGDSTPFPAEFVLPLLAPVTWATSPEEATGAQRSLAEAWTATGLIAPKDAATLAEQIVSCVPSVVWRPDPVHGWTNNGVHSHRNPAAGSWSPDHFAIFRGFTDSLGFTNRLGFTNSLGVPPTHGEPTAPVGASLRWRFDAGTPVDPTVTVSGGQVYCLTPADATLRALDATTGRQNWYTGVMDRGFGRNGVTVEKGVVHYAGGLDGLDLVGFAESGSGEADAAWTHSLDGDDTRYEPTGAYCGWADTTPVLADGYVFVAEDSLHARRLTPTGPQDGWNVGLLGMSAPRGRPVVVRDRVLVAVDEYHRAATTVHVFDTATGRRVGEQIVVDGSVQALVADGDEVFVAAAALTALDAATGSTLWSVPTEREWCGAIGVTADLVVGTTCHLPSGAPTAGPEWRYTMVGVDRHRHEVAWSLVVPGRLASSGVVVDGPLAYSVGYDANDATLHVVDVTSGELRSRYPLGRSTCLPAVADGTAYVSTADGALIALNVGALS